MMGLVQNLLTEKNHTGFQFLKYSMCGGIAFATDMVVFFLAAWFFFPALTENDLFVRLFNIQVESIPENIRIINFCIGNVIAFIVSNLTAYVLNVLFVFKAGRYSRWKELGLFYLVSAVSVGIGVAIGAMLIQTFGLSTTTSYIAKAVSTTLINYAARKFIIFHG
ncbi:MAG TPA: GtrA family protein [Pontiella sp.]|nr:GtrA family protein [Pontiella sp.]